MTEHNYPRPQEAEMSRSDGSFRPTDGDPSLGANPPSTKPVGGDRPENASDQPVRLSSRLRRMADLSTTGNDLLDIGRGADEIDRLEERCEAYKGQVKAGAEEIERLGDIAMTRAEYILELQAEIERLQTNIDDLMIVRAATIEECAQIAEGYEHEGGEAIAARIRALKEQQK